MIEFSGSCGHRSCAIRKLLVFIKIVSGRDAEIGLSDLQLIEVGVKSLRALGVTPEEIFEQTMVLASEAGFNDSPLMGDINDDSPVTSRE